MSKEKKTSNPAASVSKKTKGVKKLDPNIETAKATPEKAVKEITRRGPNLKGPVDAGDFAVLENLLKIQCTQEECCAFFEIDHKTLDARILEYYGIKFSQLSALKRDAGKISLRRTQYQKALSGNVPLLIWLGKQYLGQREKYEELVPDEDSLENSSFENLEAEIQARQNRFGEVRLKGRDLADYESRLMSKTMKPKSAEKNDE